MIHKKQTFQSAHLLSKNKIYDMIGTWKPRQVWLTSDFN